MNTYPSIDSFIDNIELPFKMRLKQPLHVNDLILVSLDLHEFVDRYAINFFGNRNEIFFHINVRLNEMYLVLNDFTMDKWNKEERCCLKSNTSKGKQKIYLLVGNDAFRVSINGTHYHKFFHRHPIELITHIELVGPVKFNYIKFCVNEVNIDDQYIPSPALLLRPSLPFEKHFSPFKMNQLILISGCPKHDRAQFHFNFENAKYIFFHISVRLVEKKIVRNSFQYNSWQREEYDLREFPFHETRSFDMLIKVDLNAFWVSINGDHYFSFKHRIEPVEEITRFKVDGQVELHALRFEQNQV